MCIDLGGCASVEVLEKVGETVGGRRCRMDFGGEGVEKSAGQSVHDENGKPRAISPLCQAPYLDGKLFEALGPVERLLGWLVVVVVVLLGGKDIAICMSFFILGGGSDLQGVGDGGHWRALEGGCPAAREGVLCLGRLETGEGLGGVKAGGSFGHGWAKRWQNVRRG